MLAVIRDQVETPKLKHFKASGLLVSRCGPRVLAVIWHQVESPKLEGFKVSGLVVFRRPGQGVSGNKTPSGNP